MAGPHLIVQIIVRGHADPGTERFIRPVTNVYNFERTVSGGSPSKAQIITAMKTTVLTPLQACLSISYLTDFIDCRFLDDYFDPFRTEALSLDGTIVGDSLPSINNATLQLKTGIRGRAFRGSKHYGPLAESSTTLDELKAANITLFETFAAAYLAGFTDAGGFVWKPILVQYKQSALNVPEPFVVRFPITEITVNSVVGMMRRRRQPA